MEWEGGGAGRGRGVWEKKLSTLFGVDMTSQAMYQ